jgi:hypothetical protein
MAGLVLAIHVFFEMRPQKNVDGPTKSGHDDFVEWRIDSS